MINKRRKRNKQARTATRSCRTQKRTIISLSISSDLEIVDVGGNDLQMSFEVIERGTNRKLVYELLLVVYSNYRRITHRF